MVEISEVDPADEATLRAFWEVEQASVRHDRQFAIPRSWDRLVAMVAHPDGWYQRTLLHVRPGCRRRGIGRALYDEAARRFRDAGRTSVCGEVYCPAGSAVIQREHPDRVAIHTDTAVDNHAMQATNRDFGYRPVERMYEMQRRDG